MIRRTYTAPCAEAYLRCLAGHVVSDPGAGSRDHASDPCIADSQSPYGSSAGLPAADEPLAVNTGAAPAARFGPDPARCLFVDIETTGFKPATSSLYLIGYAARESTARESSAWEGSAREAGDAGGWTVTLLLAERPDEEALLLETFAGVVSGYDVLVHFNGDRFDLPYLEDKYCAHGLPSPLGRLSSCDLFRAFRPLRSLLGLTRMNQKSLEAYLGRAREDRFDGGQLIAVYRAFARTGDPDLCETLLLHNREDVEGLMGLLPLAAYLDPVPEGTPLTAEPEPAAGSEPAADISTDMNSCEALRCTFALPLRVPVPVTGQTRFAAFTLEDDRCTLTIPVRRGTLRHYFKDYRNYYYLPLEDTAMHKSVASFVDPAHRQKATPETACVKRTGLFLPDDALLDGTLPRFRETVKSRDAFVSLGAPDGVRPDDTDLLSRYARSLLLRALRETPGPDGRHS